jgi:uncharacterized membrane protein
MQSINSIQTPQPGSKSAWLDLESSPTIGRTFLIFLLASAIAGGLFLARFLLTRRLGQLYLPWNLCLAWIPFGLALLTAKLADAPSRLRWLLFPAGLSWLLFLPNAPYIFTDLIHLMHARWPSPVLMWYDLLLNLVFAMTGLLLGFASLAVIQNVIARKQGRRTAWLSVIVILALSGFGVYLGRFLRWNSWDAFISPLRLSKDIVRHMSASHLHSETYVFTFFCFLFLLLSYLMCYHLAFRPEARRCTTD